MVFIALQFKTCSISYQDITDRLKVKIQGVNLWELHDSIQTFGGMIEYNTGFKYGFLFQYVERGHYFQALTLVLTSH